MKISLVGSLLPTKETKEAKIFFQKAKLNDTDGLTKAVGLATLFMETAKGSAQAIQSHSYKPFDALIKNFGCQITGFQVFNAVKGNNELIDEAKSLQKRADDRITNLGKLNLEVLFRNCKGKDIKTFLLEDKVKKFRDCLIQHLFMSLKGMKRQVLTLNKTFDNWVWLNLLLRSVQISSSNMVLASRKG